MLLLGDSSTYMYGINVNNFDALLVVVLLWHDVGDVVPWVSVESLLQALLVHVMSDESNAAAQHEQRVDGANVDVLLSFLTERRSNNKI